MMHLEFAGTRHPIGAGEAIIGSDDGCVVVLAGEDVRPRHAVLYGSPTGGGTSIRAAVPGAGILINGTRLGDDLRPLAHGDKIEIGGHELLAVDPELQPSPVPAGADFRLSNTKYSMPAMPMPQTAAMSVLYASLLVRSGPAKGQRLDVRTAAVRIGRGLNNDLVIADPSVSSTHATLQWREGLWILADAGSTNGTYADGEAIIDEMPLMPGASLRLGDVTLLFETYVEPSEPATPAMAPLPPEPESQRPAAPPVAEPQRGMPKWLIAAMVVAALAGAVAGFVFLR